MKIKREDVCKDIMHVELEDEVLLPCPFCGSSKLELYNTHTAAYWIECECSAQIYGSVFYYETQKSEGDAETQKSEGAAHLESAKDAIEKWNARIVGGSG